MQNATQTLRIRDLFRIEGPCQADSVINEIWEEKCYTKNRGIKPGDLVYDIGANIGIFSLLAAHHGANVIAFEPNPETFRLLTRNVEANGMKEKIRVINSAIGSLDGEMDFFVPVSDSIYSLGSATMSPLLATDIADHQLSLHKIRVATMTLETALAKSSDSGRNVDFMKIDCEGAEFGILENLSKETARKIDFIAMETHLGYREKDLALLLRSLGQKIVEWSPRSGCFQTGYCHTLRLGETRDIPSSPLPPVCVLDYPASIPLNRIARFDASDSFCPEDPKRVLNYSWKIGGKKQFFDKPILEKRFSLRGPKTINLQIKNPKKKSVTEKKILVLSPDYYDGSPNHVFPSAHAANEIPVSDILRFSIPKDSLPKTWLFDKIIISIKFPDSENKKASYFLCHNGQKHKIRKAYEEVEIDAPDPNMDYRFELRAGVSGNFCVSWWPVKSTTKKLLTTPGQDGICRLGQPSQKIPVWISENSAFTIDMDAIPKDWHPTTVKISILSTPGKSGKNPPLEATLCHLEKQWPVQDWYFETSIPKSELEQTCVIRVKSREKRIVYLTWWPE